MKWAALTKPITRAGLFIRDSCKVRGGKCSSWRAEVKLARSVARMERSEIGGKDAVVPASRITALPRHHGGGLDLHQRSLLDQPHHLDQRHRRIVRAADLAIDPAERFQVCQIIVDIDDIPGKPHQMLRSGTPLRDD